MFLLVLLLQVPGPPILTIYLRSLHSLKVQERIEYKVMFAIFELFLIR